ncbi:putative Myb family transcription factor [Cardamine amara subsp. amara]|uniref:Myb family transcription factor n=1 Tax=Cardamine amara subsp. amara TaxID=228776 RepID=A0ABD0ZP07_CARAN
MRNSTMRPYTRSTMSPMRWTSDLHRIFVQAVEQLGGDRSATPKKILKIMDDVIILKRSLRLTDERRVTISQVKSHLQMYRNMDREESTEERRMIHEMNMRQSQQHLQIYERLRESINFIQNQQRPQPDLNEKITTFFESSRTVEVSCNSLFQSSRVGRNEFGDDDIVAAGDGANDPLNSTKVSKCDEKLSLDLTLSLKY